MKSVNINGYKVDWQRRQISGNGVSYSVEPRVLQVLQVLVAQKGEVVSQDKILDTVWSKSIVAPNALQRCIARLRKILGDDAKHQSIIKTYSKKGYGLIAPVSFEDCGTKDQANIERFSVSDTPPFPIVWIRSIIYSLALIAAGYFYWKSLPFHNKEMPFNHISPLSSTVALERYPIATKSGEKLYFVRSEREESLALYDSLVQKNLKTGEENVIASGLKLYNAPALNLSEQDIIYSQIHYENGRKCTSIEAIPTSGSVTPDILIPCSNDKLKRPLWISAEHFLFLRSHNNGHYLLWEHNKNSQLSSPVMGVNQNILGYSFDPETDFMVVLVQSESSTKLLAGNYIKEQKRFVRSYEWLLPLGISSAHLPQPVIVAKDVYLPLGNNIFKFQVGNKPVRLTLLSNEQIYQLTPVAGGQEFIIQLGNADWDTHKREWLNADFSNVFEDSVIGTSTAFEKIAKFRPKSTSLSYLSNRTGEFEVWIEADGENKQLTFNTNRNGVGVNSYSWSTNGQQLAYVRNHKINILDVETGKTLAPALSYDILSLFQWPDEEQTDAGFLIQVSDKEEGGASVLALLDLKSNKLEKIYKGDVRWAQILSDNSVFIVDQRNRIYSLKKGSINPVESLSNIVLQSVFLAKNDTLIIQDKDLNIWQYFPLRDEKHHVTKYDANALFMTDIDLISGTLLSDNFVEDHSDLVLISRE